MNSIRLKSWQYPFNLDLTFSCGQIFGWKKTGDFWSGVHRGELISVRQVEDEIRFKGSNEEDITGFLGLTHEPDLIIASIKEYMAKFNSEGDDVYFSRVYEYSSGLRILKQDPWECLISFICSANSNVPTISKRIFTITNRLGEEKGNGYSAFPTPERLALSSEKEVRECQAGYRAPYLIKTAASVCKAPGFLDEISSMDYVTAKSALMTFSGVGPKVADCILLFSYARLDAVPVDVRIRRIITTRYLNKYSISPALASGYSYDEIAGFCRDYFGPYAGYAQQYLYAAWDRYPPIP